MTEQPTKAFEIDLEKIEEGYLYDTKMCYAENRNQAKSTLLKEIRYEDMKIRHTDKEVDYLNIPIKRRKCADKVLFEGELISKYKVSEIESERNRIAKLDEILNNPSIKYCYIKKGAMYYRPLAAGYTEYIVYAGVYLKEDAVKQAKSCRELYLVRIDIDEHNKLINSQISELQTRILS